MDRKEAEEYLIQEFPHLEELPLAIDLILDAIEKNLSPCDVKEKYDEKIQQDVFNKKEEDVKVEEVEDKLNDLAIKSAFKDF